MTIYTEGKNPPPPPWLVIWSKLVGLPTKTSDLAKLYTMDKIGIESCQIVKKHNHKFHNRFWNAYSYLKRRIMESGKYLCTVIPGRRSRKPLATPPAMGYKRRTASGGWQSGSDHSHPMHLGPLAWAPRLLVTTIRSRRGH